MAKIGITQGIFIKMAVPILSVFIVALAVMAWLIPSRMEDRVLEDTVFAAEQTAIQFKTLRKYYVQNIASVVSKGSDIKPAIDHQGNPKAIPLPATMIHDLSKLLENNGVNVKLYSDFPFPNRASRNLDQFASDAWDYLVANPDGIYKQVSSHGDKSIVRVAIADTMSAPGCVACHNSHPDSPKTDWKLGDVRGVLEIDSDVTEQLASSQVTSVTVIGFLLLMLLVILTTIYLSFKRVISKRIANISNAIGIIADGEGDLTQRLNEAGADELTELGNTVDRMLSQQQDMVRQLTRVSFELADKTDHLLVDIKNTAEHTEDQQQRTTQVAASVEQMSGAIHEVASNAATADDTAKETNQMADTGKTVVTASVNAINQLSEQVEETASVIDTLRADSEEIGKVLDVIRDIADQTNLLALNASIEAARAGEQGRGFAVVADEVRNLAGRTQNSTHEIQDMINRLQTGASNAVHAMQSGQESARNSVENASQAGDSLEHITQAVSNLSFVNSQIAAAVEQQGAVANDISEHVSFIQIKSEETSAESERNQQVCQELSALAQQLRQSVSHFKVD
ncbi:methyl-accepting chemotaxis protein [Neptuniibacter sp. QD34_54]|uniref:methyl-accepting chemotaxis protein n=1 Tax=Neptuniibacter sp. QD34_54 TaxID=3398208 RepID=UPI0039F6336B